MFLGCRPTDDDRQTRKNASTNLGLKEVDGDSQCLIEAYQAPSYSLIVHADDPVNRRLEELKAQLPIGLEAVVEDFSRPLTDQLGRYHIPIVFSFGQTTLCSWQYYATVHDLDRGLWIKGKIPQPELLDRGIVSSDASIPKSDLLKTNVESILGKPVQELAFSSEESCLMELDEQLHVATLLSLSIDGRSYEGAAVAGKIEYLSPRFLHATGSFQVYDGGNNLSNNLTEIIIEDMQDSGYLCSSYFTLETDEGELSFDPDLNFKFDPSDKRFSQSNAFANASKMMHWFLEIDKDAHWSGAQIELRLSHGVRERASGPTYDNPAHRPSLRRPIIVLPDVLAFASNPNQPLLENLTTDFDVVAHELGHHIVAQYVGFSSTIENLMVHEGLADFFLYAKTGNSCLGESICSQGSSACEIRNKCLRSGDNVLSLEDPAISRAITKNSREHHMASQVVSGMLWEIGSTQVGLANMAKLAMQALRYMNKATDTSDLVSSLLQADRDLFAGQNNCTIQSVARRRGIKEFNSGSSSCK